MFPPEFSLYHRAQLRDHHDPRLRDRALCPQRAHVLFHPDCERLHENEHDPCSSRGAFQHYRPAVAVSHLDDFSLGVLQVIHEDGDVSLNDNAVADIDIDTDKDILLILLGPHSPGKS